MYLARDIKHDRLVAIKVFKPELAETLGVERFTREIRTAANLNHPHILTVLDSGTADGLLYYVMPYADGESLRARITREGGLPIADVVRVMREVADALAAAHKAGVVHRDIKPDNVLLSGRHALVADFGVAKAISESTGKNHVTTVGVALGTPAYMAPEQAAADPHVDHRADIYALGILGYEMLTGEPPFVRRSPQEVLAAQVTEPAPPVSSRRQSVPPALEALVAKCLAKQPGDRYQSANDVEAELERVMTPSGGMSPTSGVVPTSATAAVSPAKKMPFSKTGILTAAAALVLVAAWYGVGRTKGGSAGDDNVVAVFPFEVSGPADAQYLREGMVSILETNFTGEGGPRAVASQTMIAQWRRQNGEAQGLTDEEARDVARTVGAGQMLRGSVVATGAELVISATLTRASGNGESVQAQVKGPADSVASLAASLAAQLIAVRGGQPADRAVTLQHVPPAALRAYLDGKAAFRAAKYSDAVAMLDNAIGIDSTFALAAMALAQARGMNPTTFAVAAGRDLSGLAFRHRATLGPRDLKLLELSYPSLFTDAPLSQRAIIQMTEKLAAQVPDRMEAWYLVGDRYMHWGEGAGFSRAESITRARQAFAEALRLDPGIEFIKQHLADMLLWQGERTTHARVVDSLDIAIAAHRLSAAIAVGDSSAMRAILISNANATLDDQVSLAYNAGSAGNPTLADSIARVLVTRSAPVSDRRAALRWTRVFYESMGRPADATRIQGMLRDLDDSGTPSFPTEDIFFAVFGGGDRVAATRAAAALSARPEQRTPAGLQQAARDSWVTGVWSQFIGDSAAVRANARRLDAITASREMTGALTVYRILSPLLLAMDSPSRELLLRADSALADGPPVTPIIRMSLNLIVARGFERVGDPQRAAVAARRTGGMDPTFSSVSTAANRDRGRILLAAGDTTEAVAAWQAYILWRGTAEPSQRALDEPIRAKLAELERREK